jgi:copper chaperone
MTLHYQVADMSCDHCVKAVGDAVRKAVPGATVQVDLGTHHVTVDGTEDKAKVEAAIQDAGYTPKG